MNRPFDRRLAIFLLPALLMLFYANAAMHFRSTPDQTYVYLQYARNTVEGDGISFRPGVPEFGVPGPLWLGVITLAGAMRIDPALAAKLTDLFIACLALLVFFFVAYELLRDLFAAVAASVAFAMNVWLVRWSGSGMESSMALLLLMGVFWFALRNEYFIAVVLVALLGLVRPEGWLLIFPLCIDVWVNSVSRRRGLNLIAAMVLVFVSLIIPWLVYAAHSFGRFLPEIDAGAHPAGFAMELVRRLVVSDGISATVLVLGALLLRYYFAAQRDGEDRIEPPFYFVRSAIIPGGWIILGLLGFAFSGARSNVLVLISPAILLLAFLFFHRIVIAMGNPRRIAAGLAVFACAVILQNQTTWFLSVKPAMEGEQQGMESCLIPIGRWFNQHTPPGTVIEAAEPGAIAFYSQRMVVGYSQRLQGDKPEYLVKQTDADGGPDELPGMTRVFQDSVARHEIGGNRWVYYSIYAENPSGRHGE